MVVCAICSCRTLTPEQQAEKAKKEAIRQKEGQMMFNTASRAISAQDFVLEANALVFRSGTRATVNSSTNYIAVKGDHATVQVAPFNGGGPNGVGGITVDGTPTRFKTKTDKRGNAIISFSVTGINISATVSMTLYKDSDKATALISPNFNSNTVTLEGNIVSTDRSSVIKGIGF